MLSEPMKQSLALAINSLEHSCEALFTKRIAPLDRIMLIARMSDALFDAIAIAEEMRKNPMPEKGTADDFRPVFLSSMDDGDYLITGRIDSESPHNQRTCDTCHTELDDRRKVLAIRGNVATVVIRCDKCQHNNVVLICDGRSRPTTDEQDVNTPIPSAQVASEA